MLSGQESPSKKLIDSIGSLKNFPDTKTALPLYIRMNKLSKKEGDRNTELHSKVYISYFYDVLGNTIEANEAIDEAFEFAQDTSGIDPEKIINVYYLMYKFEKRKGNRIKANDINRKYIELELKNGANDVQMGISYYHMAAGLRILGDLENALLYSTKSFDLYENAEDSLFENDIGDLDKNLLLFRSLQTRGLVYKYMKKYPEAIQDYEESFKYLKESKHLNKTRGKKSTVDYYNRITDAFLLKGDLEKASGALQELSYLNKNESHENFRYYELLTALQLKTGDSTRSSNHIRKAIELANIQLKG
jgi:tetratricopeptide (TPR) repeat protein